jgi:hypothetical protein
MSSQPATTGPPSAYPDYDDDLVAWALANARLLRAGRVQDIDVDHLAEELEDLGKSERRALRSHLRNLILHLLKWAYQPGLRGPSWRRSINNARRALDDIIEDSPSLERELTPMLPKTYGQARADAALETGLPETAFPPNCPFGLEQLRDDRFLPD